jgi:Ras-related protein Rab-1A
MTIGTSFAVKTVDLGQVMVKLQIWDLAGQPHFGGVRPLFYQGSTGVIYVFSVTDRASFDHLSGWLEEANKNAGNIPGILIANKTDLVDQRVVSQEEGKAFADQIGLDYIETSAKMDENVGDAFTQVAKTIIQSKWPEYGKAEEEAVPAVPEAPATPVEEPVVPEPVSGPAEEITVEEEPPEPIPLPPIEEPEEEPIPLEDTSTPAVISEPTSVEPIESTPISEVNEPSVAPQTPIEPIPPQPEIPQPEHPPMTEPEETADVVVSHKAESSLVEFIGVDPHSIQETDFEKRAVHAMNRLGVSEVGVLGTFLRSLIRQGQRDVVIESLESLQEEH